MPDPNASNATSATVLWWGKNWQKNSDWFCAVQSAPERRQKLFPKQRRRRQILLFFQQTSNRKLLSLSLNHFYLFCKERLLFFHTGTFISLFSSVKLKIKKNKENERNVNIFLNASKWVFSKHKSIFWMYMKFSGPLIYI